MAIALTEDTPRAPKAAEAGPRPRWTRIDTFEAAFALAVITYSLFAAYIYTTQGAKGGDDETPPVIPATALYDAVDKLHLGLLAISCLLPLARLRQHFWASLRSSFARCLAILVVAVTSWHLLALSLSIISTFHVVTVQLATLIAAPSLTAYHDTHGTWPANLESALPQWRQTCLRLTTRTFYQPGYPGPALVFPPWPIEINGPAVVPLAAKKPHPQQ